MALLATGCAAGSRGEPAAVGGYGGDARASAESSSVAPAAPEYRESSSGENDSAPPPAPPMQMGYPQQQAPTKSMAPAEPAPADASKPNSVPADARSKEHLVYTADFTLAVYQVELGLEKAEEVARSLGGYLASRGDHEIVIRVPRDRFREALGQIEKLGDVVHRDVKAVDVTDEFVDTESRLKNARVMRDRLQTLLAKAAVKEAIEIEKELGRVTEQIEVLEGKLKSLSDRIAFSTLTVRYAAKGSDNTRPSFRLPFAWVHSLGVHRLLNFQQTSGQ